MPVTRAAVATVTAFLRSGPLLPPAVHSALLIIDYCLRSGRQNKTVPPGADRAERFDWEKNALVCF